MPTFLLEAYGTDSRYFPDIRHRSYTTSRKKAEQFMAIPKIQFTDSGHGIVFWSEELPPRTHKLPSIRGLEEYIKEHLS